MKFRYNEDKNAKLLDERNIGFAEIIEEINSDNILEIIPHPSQAYPNQEIMYVKCLGRVYAIPYVIEDDGTLFLKTLYPSRKATKRLL